MISLILGCISCFLVDRGGWILVGDSSCIYAMSMLVESSRVAECSTFRFDVADASGISMAAKFLLIKDSWRDDEL
ncbi:hypothetical protein V6N13_030782 [Hibiscus sabdariffa]